MFPYQAYDMSSLVHADGISELKTNPSTPPKCSPVYDSDIPSSVVEILDTPNSQLSSPPSSRSSSDLLNISNNSSTSTSPSTPKSVPDSTHANIINDSSNIDVSYSSSHINLNKKDVSSFSSSSNSSSRSNSSSLSNSSSSSSHTISPPIDNSFLPVGLVSEDLKDIFELYANKDIELSEKYRRHCNRK
jgi:hypothetical protein